MAITDYDVVDLIESAVRDDAPETLLQLGLIYCSGEHVEADYVAAHKWFNLAALRGNQQAKHYRLELSREMTRTQIARAQREAREWLTRH